LREFISLSGEFALDPGAAFFGDALGAEASERLEEVADSEA
jgi:hypothetical protein